MLAAESFQGVRSLGRLLPLTARRTESDAHVAWISLPSMGMAGEVDFELVAASLRADAGDLGVFVEALAVKLEQALQNGHYVSPRLSPPAAPLCTDLRHQPPRRVRSLSQIRQRATLPPPLWSFGAVVAV